MHFNEGTVVLLIATVGHVRGKNTITVDIVGLGRGADHMAATGILH